jgi:fibronectin type 3 domain-containing protein
MSKRSGILVAALCVTALIAGCDGNPTAVDDTVPPVAVLDLDVQVVASSIEVHWTANSEPDLAAYRVYRSVNGNLPVSVAVTTTNSYIDTSVSNGARYRYEVSAVDEAGNESSRVSTTYVLIPGGTTRPPGEVGD